MNTLLETPAHAGETVDFCHDDFAGADHSHRNFPNPGNPMPLWLEARIQTIDFRRADLVRTHWRKVWRSVRADGSG